MNLIMQSYSSEGLDLQKREATTLHDGVHMQTTNTVYGCHTLTADAITSQNIFS